MLSRLAFAANQASAGSSLGLGEGAILAGKYRVERVLGSGGMGVVVAAIHLQLEERVAIKFLFLEALANAEITTRFMREARAAVRIKSEHVARVIDVGTFDGGVPFIVMEYLEGSDLAQLLASHGPLPFEVAVAFILQAGEALAEAHGLGIVHRDLKPSNLFIIRRPDGSNAIKVLDFGISKVPSTNSASHSESITRTGTLMGSPMYMSPEQMASPRDVDARSDIWGLGAILFEMVTGQAAFSGETVPQLCATILDARVLPMSAIRSDIPPALEAVVARCLEKDRRRRFQTIAELAEALQDLAPVAVRAYVDRIRGIWLASAAPPFLAIDEEAAPAGLTADESTAMRKSARWARVSFILAAVVVVAAGFALLPRHRARKTEVSSSVALSEPSSPTTAALSSETEPPPEMTARRPSPSTTDLAPSLEPDEVGSSMSNPRKIIRIRPSRVPPTLPAALTPAAVTPPPSTARTPSLAASMAPSPTASPISSARSRADLFSDRK